MHEYRRSGLLHTVMRYQVEVDRSNLVAWADQVELVVPEQVAQVEGAKLTERYEAAHRLAVVVWRCRVDVSLKRRALGRVHLPGSGEWPGNRLASRRDDAPVESLQGNVIAGLEYRVARLAVDSCVGRLESGHCLCCLDALAVVHEVSDGNTLRQRFEASDVIRVVVRADEVVDLSHAG